MTNNEEPESPGWEAIDKRLADFYRDQEPKHYGTVMKFMLGGPDPIDGVSVFQHKTGHLHYISYGLTELYKKESDDPHTCLLYTSPSPRDRQKSRMPSSA